MMVGTARIELRRKSNSFVGANANVPRKNRCIVNMLFGLRRENRSEELLRWERGERTCGSGHIITVTDLCFHRGVPRASMVMMT